MARKSRSPMKKSGTSCQSRYMKNGERFMSAAVVGDIDIIRKAALPKSTFNPRTELVALTLALHWGEKRESTSALIACAFATIHVHRVIYKGVD